MQRVAQVCQRQLILVQFIAHTTQMSIKLIAFRCEEQDASLHPSPGIQLAFCRSTLGLLCCSTSYVANSDYSKHRYDNFPKKNIPLTLCTFVRHNIHYLRARCVLKQLNASSRGPVSRSECVKSVYCRDSLSHGPPGELPALPRLPSLTE